MNHMKPIAIDDKNLLKTFVKERNIISTTQKSYENTIRVYNKKFNTTITQTIHIAKKEQKKGTDWEKTQLYQTLINFREFCYYNYSENMANKTFNQFKALLKHKHIIIHELPYWNPRQNHRSKPISYDDLPTTKELQSAYLLANHLLKAIITFQISTGCDKNTTLNLKIQDFIDATKKYHETNDLQKAITILENETAPIGQWRLKRGKTNKYYTTFNTPESTTDITLYLKSLEKLPKSNEKLFPIHDQTLMRELRNINNKLMLGKVNGYVRLRTHMFRKYHASHLYHNKEGEPLMTLDDIDYLQGRGKSNTRESYFYEDIAHLKMKYSRVMHRVTLFDTTHIGEDSPEYQSLQKKNKDLHEKLVQEKQRMHDLQGQVDDIRSDNEKLGKMLRELLEKS